MFSSKRKKGKYAVCLDKFQNLSQLYNTVHSPGLPGIVSDVVIKQTYFIHTVGGSYSNYSTVY